MATIDHLTTLSADAVTLHHLQDDRALAALLHADPKIADRMIKVLLHAPATTQACVADSVRYLEKCVSNVTNAVAIQWVGSPDPATVRVLGDGDGDDRVRAFVGVYDMVRTWLGNMYSGPANWSDLAKGSGSIWITRNDVQFLGSMEQMTETVFNYMCKGVRAHCHNQPLDYNWLMALRALLDPLPEGFKPRWVSDARDALTQGLTCLENPSTRSLLTMQLVHWARSQPSKLTGFESLTPMVLFRLEPPGVSTCAPSTSA